MFIHTMSLTNKNSATHVTETAINEKSGVNDSTLTVRLKKYLYL